MRRRKYTHNGGLAGLFVTDVGGGGAKNLDPIRSLPQDQLPA